MLEIAYDFNGSLYCEACAPVGVGEGFMVADNEADTPLHCAGCGFFFKNKLTRDGFFYVQDAISDAGAKGDEMICFFCKAEIDSDHICQEIVEYMEDPVHTVEEVGRIRAQLQATEAKHRRAE